MKVVLKNVRLAFPQLFEPKAFGEVKPAFSASFLIDPVENKDVLESVKAALAQVATEKWGTKSSEMLTMLKAQNKLCLHDGAEKAKYDGFMGNLFISARSETAPGVFDNKKDASGTLVRLQQRDGKPYAGCYVNASIDIWAQANTFGTRINAALLGVQFHRDGEAFSGSRPSDGDEFEEFATAGSSVDDLF